MKPNPHLNKAILEIVDNQLQANDPPETKATYDRLRAEGHTDKEARNLIGCAVVSEIYDVLNTQQPFDRQRFVAMLERLPELPWADEE